MMRPDSLRLHVRHGGTAHAKDAGQIDAQHLLPGLDREFVDGLAIRRLDADAGIVDENVDAAGFLGDPRNDGVDFTAVGDIHDIGEMRLAKPWHGCGRLRRMALVEIGKDDPRAAFAPKRPATARPMPCAAPVTTATCPVRSTCMAFPQAFRLIGGWNSLKLL